MKQIFALSLIWTVFSAGCDSTTELPELTLQEQLEGCALASLVRPIGTPYQYNYNDQGRLTGWNTEVTSVTYGYNEGGQIVSIDWFSTISGPRSPIEIEYDAQGRMTSWLQGGNALIFEYLADSIIETVDGERVSAIYTDLNEFNKPETIVEFNPFGDLLQAGTFSYDEFGNVIEESWQSETFGSQQISYTYNYGLKHIDTNPTPELFKSRIHAVATKLSVGRSSNENLIYSYLLLPVENVLQMEVVGFTSQDPHYQAIFEYHFDCD